MINFVMTTGIVLQINLTMKTKKRVATLKAALTVQVRAPYSFMTFDNVNL